MPCLLVACSSFLRCRSLVLRITLNFFVENSIAGLTGPVTLFPLPNYVDQEVVDAGFGQRHHSVLGEAFLCVAGIAAGFRRSRDIKCGREGLPAAGACGIEDHRGIGMGRAVGPVRMARALESIRLFSTGAWLRSPPV